MTSKLRFEFSYAELQTLISGLRRNNNPELVTITDKLSKRALKNVLLNHLEPSTNKMSLPKSANDVQGIVIEFLAAVSGLATDQITPGTKIEIMNLSDQKLDYLRANLNVWIKEQGGTGKILTGEMNGANTVQNIIDLVASKF